MDHVILLARLHLPLTNEEVHKNWASSLLQCQGITKRNLKRDRGNSELTISCSGITYKLFCGTRIITGMRNRHVYYLTSDNGACTSRAREVLKADLAHCFQSIDTCF